VYMVHGVGDGLVPYNQSVELATLLRANLVRTEFTTVLTRGPASEPGTTIDGYAPIPGHTSPFGGHASEASKTHIVGVEGFRLLREWYAAGGLPVRCGDVVLDGTTGLHTRPAPSC